MKLLIGNSVTKIPRLIKHYVCLDPNFKLSSHVNDVVRICNFRLRNLWRIRRFNDTTTCHHAVRSLVLSNIYYCNSLLTILIRNDKNKMDSVVNRAARLIYAVGRGTRTSPLLTQLHWSPFSKRIC